MTLKIHAVRLGYGLAVVVGFIAILAAFWFGIGAFKQAIGAENYRIFVPVFVGGSFLLAISYGIGKGLEQGNATQKEDLSEDG